MGSVISDFKDALVDPASIFTGGGTAADKAFDPLGIFSSISDPSPTPTNSADTTLANISLQDWGNFKSTFFPLQNYLTQMVNNPAFSSSQVGQASQNFNNGMQNSLGQYGREMGRMGLTPTTEQTAFNTEQTQQAQATGNVEAVNRTNMGLQNLSNQILGSGLSSSYPVLPGTQGGSSVGLA